MWENHIAFCLLSGTSKQTPSTPHGVCKCRKKRMTFWAGVGVPFSDGSWLRATLNVQPQYCCIAQLCSQTGCNQCLVADEIEIEPELGGNPLKIRLHWARFKENAFRSTERWVWTHARFQNAVILRPLDQFNFKSTWPLPTTQFGWTNSSATYIMRTSDACAHVNFQAHPSVNEKWSEVSNGFLEPSSCSDATACQLNLPTHTVPVLLHDLPEETNNFVSLLTFNVAGTKGGAYPCIGHNTKFQEENHALALAERPRALHRHPHAIAHSLGEFLKLLPSVECAFLVLTLTTTSGLTYLSNISRIIPLSAGTFAVFAKSSTCWAALGIPDSENFGFEVQDVQRGEDSSSRTFFKSIPYMAKMCLTSVTVTSHVLMSSRFLAKRLQPNLRSEWPVT